MPTPEQFSQTNVANSIAVLLAAKLLAAGYLIYWHDTDTLQTTTTLYPNFHASAPTYVQDPTLGPLLASGVSVVSLVNGWPANRTFVTRLPVDGAGSASGTVALPALAIAVGAAVPTVVGELGSSLRWRIRRLLLDGYARSDPEQQRLADLLAIWFDHETPLPIENHDDGTRDLIDHVVLTRPITATPVVVTESEAATFRVTLTARLEYAA